jgi:hypothetical protein
MTQLTKLHTIIARIGLISHAPVSAYEVREASDTSEDIGGRRPSGSDRDRPPRGAEQEEWEAWRESYVRKTPDYFRHRLAHCHTERAITALLAEAEGVLEAWRRTPIPPGNEPRRCDAQWKRFIAESSEDAGDLARRFEVTRRYVNMIRQQYREAA